MSDWLLAMSVSAPRICCNLTFFIINFKFCVVATLWSFNVQLVETLITVISNGLINFQCFSRPIMRNASPTFYIQFAIEVTLKLQWLQNEIIATIIIIDHFMSQFEKHEYYLGEATWEHHSIYSVWNCCLQRANKRD